MSDKDLLNSLAQSQHEHYDLDALMAQGRRLRSEAFIFGVTALFQAPSRAMTKAQQRLAQGAYRPKRAKI
ncbi:MAG: hypothetical protein AAF213_04115 [Pseudomonadota bacterium]